MESTLCVLCGLPGETTLHLSRDCEYTRSVIGFHSVLKDTCFRWGTINTSTLQWLDQCAKDLSLTNFGDLLFILWSCWFERNDRVWDERQRAAIDVNSCLSARLCEFRFHTRVTKASRSCGRVRWKAPTMGVWKINIDGA